jgi:hypothetical protein
MEAAQRIEDLEAEHGPRRRWPWADMGLAPLALALAPLAQMAALCNRSFGGARLSEMAEAYRDELWQVDAAARQALAVARAKADLQAVGAALRAVYLPWLMESNERFQALVRQDGYAGSQLVAEDAGGAYQARGECWVFVDGLRYDVARELAERLAGEGHEVAVETAWAPVPSVTASGKVLCSPVAQVARGRGTDRDFVPSHGTLDRPLDADQLRRAIRELGWQVLGPDDAGDPGGRAWTECGDLDHFGHQHGIRLAREVPVLLDEIMDQVRFLLDAGWKRLRMVTDHGWLLMPGGLPKTELHRSLTETRWGRCALLTDSAGSTDLTLTWTWCADVRIASGPGVASFIAGMEYAHGGVSLQESLIPVLRVQRGAAVGEVAGAEIDELVWKGLRCRVRLKAAGDGLQADLRRKANDPASSVSGGPRPIEDGKGSLMVEDDELEGEAVSLVILDAAGQVVARALTQIGGDD